MRIYFDTEFIESGAGKPIHLISLGAVSEDGHEFFRVNLDCPFDEANQWVKDNVIAHLPHPDINWSTLSDMSASFREWVNDVVADGTPLEFWAYYADYDWVVLCQMFGTMMDLPKGFPMYCRDLKQVIDERGLDISDSDRDDEHSAIADARWVKSTHEALL